MARTRLHSSKFLVKSVCEKDRPRNVEDEVFQKASPQDEDRFEVSSTLKF